MHILIWSGSMKYWLLILLLLNSAVYAQTNDSNTKLYAYQIKDAYPEYSIKEYLKTKLVYPAFAKANNIQGNVSVKFVVTEKGRIDSVTIVQGLSSDCDSEAIRVVKSMPDWVPAKVRRSDLKKWIKVPMRYTQPITFILTN